jgi:hypothetical protein
MGKPWHATTVGMPRGAISFVMEEREEQRTWAVRHWSWARHVSIGEATARVIAHRRHEPGEEQKDTGRQAPK